MYIHIYTYIYIYIYTFIYIYTYIYILNIQNTELMENDNFHLFAANRKRNFLLFAQTETENVSSFPLVGKRSTVFDDRCFSKLADLWNRERRTKI
jgi:hypothetical protein